jgi:hypothetical protein
MSNLERISLEDTIRNIRNLHEVGKGITEGRLTTSSKIGYLALCFCLGTGNYDSVEVVVDFWEKLDDLVKENSGEIVTVSHHTHSLRAGRLEPDNDGLIVKDGYPLLPVTMAAECIFSGLYRSEWKEFPKDKFELGKAYRVMGRNEESSTSLSGMEFGQIIHGIDFAFGETASAQLLHKASLTLRTPPFAYHDLVVFLENHSQTA